MMRLGFTFLSCIVITLSVAQEYTSSSIFAHNDYAQPIPFYAAYSQHVGFIEADVFLQQQDLVVAHTLQETDKNKTLDELYLKPLQQQVVSNNGFAYASPENTLTLMIDLKTEGVSTLNALVNMLMKYPLLLSCKSLQIAVSGNVPNPSLWHNFPDFIHFDGRPGIEYTDDQFMRISLISTRFKDHAQWNGKGPLTKPEHDKIVALIDAVHAKGKKIRFWANPDFADAWITLMNLKVDILGTDDVAGLATLIRNQPTAK